NTDTPTQTPSSTATLTPTGTGTASPTSTPTASPTNSATSTATSSPTLTMTQTTTPTPSATASSTPTATPTRTATPTVPPNPHAVLFFSWTGTGTKYVHHYATTGESTAAFQLPSAGRVSNLFVTCSTGITVGTYTITFRKNGVNTTLGCALSGGAKACTDSVDAIDFVPADELNLKVVNSGTGQTPTCRASATLTASGGSTPHAPAITLQPHSH